MKLAIADLIRREGREPGGGRSLMPLVIALATHWKTHGREIDAMWREVWEELA